MAKFDSYPDNSAPADADLLISTDVSDTSADATGTTKKLTVSTLLNSGLDATVAALTATDGILASGATGSSIPNANALEVINTNAASGEQRFKLSVTNSGGPRLDVMSDDGTAVGRTIFIARSDGEFRLTANTSVTVPALTATGLSSIEATTPRLRLYETDWTADLRKYEIRVASGNMTMIALDDAGSAIRTPLQFAGNGNTTLDAGILNLNASLRVDMTGSTAVTVPTPTAVDHAVKVVAWDATTGRYAVQGPNGTVEQGDTGWRDVSADLTNGFTGTLLVRRVGNMVSVRLSFDASAKTDDSFYVRPTGVGFDAGGATVANTGNRGFWALNNSTADTDVSEWFSPGGAAGASLKTSSVLGANYGEATYATDDAWPSSLPGTAV